MSGGIKYDQAKPRTDLLPVRPLLDTAEIWRLGAEKYGQRNWEQGLDWSRPYGALLRHIFAWWSGEDNDPETGRSHLDHAACCIMMLQEFKYSHPELDDRPCVKSPLSPEDLCRQAEHHAPATPPRDQPRWVEHWQRRPMNDQQVVGEFHD